MTEIPSLGFGPDAMPLRTAVGPAWVVASVESIPPHLRSAAFASRCRDLRYYEVTETGLPDQFEYRYFVLHDEASGGWAIQPLFFVQQDLLAGLPQSVRSLFNGIRKAWPGFLKLRMMMIGCATSEGELDHDQPWLPRALLDVTEAYRRQARASLILLKDFPSSYRPALAVFSSHGYQRAPSMPAARLELDFKDFEEYLMERLSKVFRKNLRRKLRASEEGPPLTMEVLTDASALVDDLFPLYLQTYERSDFNFEKLTPEYFRLIGQRMPDRARYFIWRQNGRIIAFSLCMVHEGILHDVALGLEYPLALELSLYFRTWHDVITWGLQNGIKAYHTGPLNYDPKLHLKMALSPLDLYARHNWAFLNPIFKLAIKYLEPTRHDPVIKKFANASELY
ncbi:MAG: GNAT family N-acetyltransferase [Chthoniobacter sp.]|uniref:GNAT family N-acetyltransferase n=1 Tax=Chthoniobacter sp. TaxID=2510640 RepID=UPI0032AC725A